MLRQNVNIRIGGPITPIVKKLLIINGAVFLIQKIVGIWYPGYLEYLFGLSYVGFVQEFKLWQIVTYMFLHEGWFHILFNLLGLWMFAGELEQLWGSRRFLQYYLFTGIGAGLFIAFMNYILYEQYNINALTIGASGAIYGILLAYGMTWPNRTVLLYFILPIKIKYLVIGFGLIEFFGTLSTAAGTGGTISHIGHLGGLVAGIVYMLVWRRRSERKSSAGDNFIEKFFKNLRMRKKKKQIDTRIKAKKTIDELLEKIARHGMSSLTAQERKDLEWARRHYYPDSDETVH